MKSLSVLLVGLALAQAASVHDAHREFMEFKATHSKTYESLEEEQSRFAIFLDNKRIIAEHNALYEAGEISWEVGMNVFGDMTDAEFKSKMTGQAMPRSNRTENGARVSCPYFSDTVHTPDSFDWRDHGAVTPVKDQGFCGSCWSFAATGSMEGQYHKTTGELVSLSEQNLLDCAQNWGCNGGGRSDIALSYIASSGVNSEQTYPYEAQQQWCRQSAVWPTYHCSGCAYPQRMSEAGLKDAVATQAPVAVAIDSSPLHFQFYRSGIIDDPSCSSTKLDHAVLAVGYGQSTKKFWTIKNSWGASWGTGGYFQMARDKGNMCGVATDTVYAVAPCYQQ